ncbi:MAG: [protein-PII] uridylyltransferase [Verrucomicrobiota bacterium]
MSAAYLETLERHAAESLPASLEDQLSPAERVAFFRKFLKTEEAAILQLHREGGGGSEIASLRSALIDLLLRHILEATIRSSGEKIAPFCLIATGGYGRGLLNPGSDIDILFLLARSSASIPKTLEQLIQNFLYQLWDMGFKIGHASRSISECIEQARLNQENKTALIDARLISGEKSLFATFETRFAKECLDKGQEAFFEMRRRDIRSRHEKYSHTVFLQEPNVKESCGGLRDFQNIEWIARVRAGSSRLSTLVEKKFTTAAAVREMEEAYDFIHRVRNELHYHSGKSTDLLTLHLQGVVATAFDYPQKNILRSTEAFMRDYYRHARHIYQHTTSLMEAFQLEEKTRAESGLRSFLTFRRKKREEFDGFIARDGRLFPAHADLFKEDPGRLMRLFQHCQVRNLRLSPQLRRLIAQHWDDIDRPFRYARTNREIFQAILERKGEVARILRLMHRIGFLGRYLPEFGALDCLVQHEFFHRYTADEHTLRCIDQLDQLVDGNNPRHAIFRKLFREIQDPYALYLALILHDTGRAENVREHTDGSAILAAKVCTRLQIQGARRSLIMFLVDNHLVFWRAATTKNLDDPEVIAEFATIIKNKANLDALYLFTFVDSSGTAPDAWTGWKESLMQHLHAATSRFLEAGRERYSALLDEDRVTLQEDVTGILEADSRPYVDEHFRNMPAAAFHFREAPHIVTQIRTVRNFLSIESESGDPAAFSIRWVDHPEKGYSEMIIATRDKPLLLEKICCALASEQINILSADLFSRTDRVVVNIFRVCTTNFEPVSDSATRKRFLETLDTILHAEKYDPDRYLRRRVNFLKPRTDQGIPVPVRASVSNTLHPTCTTVEIQALDRIGLLHDLFLTINRHGLTTAHARICTEKGVAMDTLYITTSYGSKVLDPKQLRELEGELSVLIDRPELPA